MDDRQRAAEVVDRLSDYKWDPHNVNVVADAFAVARREVGLVSVDVTAALLSAMRQSECPRCGWRWRGGRRLEIRTRERVAALRLEAHALEVHGADLLDLRDSF